MSLSTIQSTVCTCILYCTVISRPWASRQGLQCAVLYPHCTHHLVGLLWPHATQALRTRWRVPYSVDVFPRFIRLKRPPPPHISLYSHSVSGSLTVHTVNSVSLLPRLYQTSMDQMNTRLPLFLLMHDSKARPQFHITMPYRCRPTFQSARHVAEQRGHGTRWPEQSRSRHD